MKKLNFANVIQKLTRNEMRYVMAGSGADSVTGYCTCGKKPRVQAGIGCGCVKFCSTGLCS